MTHDEMIAVIQAHKAGKAIEVRDRGWPIAHWGASDPNWNFLCYDYRIKPEPPKPREWWIYPVKENESYDNAIFKHPPVNPDWIRVREVLL